MRWVGLEPTRLSRFQRNRQTRELPDARLPFPPPPLRRPPFPAAARAGNRNIIPFLFLILFLPALSQFLL